MYRSLFFVVNSLIVINDEEKKDEESLVELRLNLDLRNQIKSLRVLEEKTRLNMAYSKLNRNINYSNNNNKNSGIFHKNTKEIKDEKIILKTELVDERSWREDGDEDGDEKEKFLFIIIGVSSTLLLYKYKIKLNSLEEENDGVVERLSLACNNKEKAQFIEEYMKAYSNNLELKKIFTQQLLIKGGVTCINFCSTRNENKKNNEKKDEKIDETKKNTVLLNSSTLLFGVGSSSGFIKIYRVINDEIVLKHEIYAHSKGEVKSIGFLTSNFLYSIANDLSVKIWFIPFSKELN